MAARVAEDTGIQEEKVVDSPDSNINDKTGHINGIGNSNDNGNYDGGNGNDDKDKPSGAKGITGWKTTTVKIKWERKAAVIVDAILKGNGKGDGPLDGITDDGIDDDSDDDNNDDDDDYNGDDAFAVTTLPSFLSRLSFAVTDSAIFLER